MGSRGDRRSSFLITVVDEVAPWPVGAEPDGVEGLAHLRLVLGVAGKVPQLVDAVSKLALLAVLAAPALGVGPTQLRLVATSAVLPLVL